MEYTIQKLGKLAGISTRTLRYYDELGILKPARINSSGYRIYGRTEIDRLQQILLYRALDVELSTIAKILANQEFDYIQALYQHREKLREKKETLERLILNVEKTIEAAKGRTMMSDHEKFEGMKKEIISRNEEQYGDEIRRNYGKEAVAQSNQKLLNMTQQDYDQAQQLADDIKRSLGDALREGNPAGELAQATADLHRQWLSLYWDKYTKEAHAGLADMYMADERFKAYYDEVASGATEFLRDAIHIYTGIDLG